MNAPTWLPPIQDMNGDFKEKLEILYRIFEKDIKYGKLSFQGLPIWYERTPVLFAGRTYERGFLHLLTRDDKDSGNRLMDFPRAELLPWCGPLIQNANDAEVKVWDNVENGRRKTYVWLEAHDYLLVLEKQRRKLMGEPIEVYFLLTSFHIDGASQKRRFLTKYESREIVLP